jgi:hypothetical protein
VARTGFARLLDRDLIVDKQVKTHLPKCDLFSLLKGHPFGIRLHNNKLGLENRASRISFLRLIDVTGRIFLSAIVR